MKVYGGIPAWKKYLDYSHEKQENEIQLAKRLYELFDEDAVIDKVRTVLEKVLSYILLKSSWNVVQKAMDEEKYLDVWQKFKIDLDLVGLYDLWRMLKNFRRQSFNASDCADLVRFIGCWVEKDDGAGLNPIKKTFRPRVTFLPTTSAPKPPVQMQKIDQSLSARLYENVWSQAEKAGQPKRRYRKGFGDITGGGRADWVIEHHIDSVRRKGFSNKSKAGMQLKRAYGPSNVLKIDRIFGLQVGADISGTTADATFFSRQWGEGVLHTYYYLLPAATIVYNCHHTLIEVALTLSLNRLIDYHIGYYSSLLVKTKERVPEDITHLKNIPSILEGAENSKKNHRIIAWFDGSALDGLVEFEGGYELEQYKRIFNAKKWLYEAPAFQNFPTREDVFGVMSGVLPSLGNRINNSYVIK